MPITAPNRRLWLRLMGQIIIFPSNSQHGLKQQWRVSSHNNRWPNLEVQGTTFSSGLSPGREHANHKPIQQKARARLGLYSTSGQADIDTQTAGYQRINTSLDLHFAISACPGDGASLHLFCVFYQHRPTSRAVKCVALFLLLSMLNTASGGNKRAQRWLHRELLLCLEVKFPAPATQPTVKLQSVTKITSSYFGLQK